MTSLSRFASEELQHHASPNRKIEDWKYTQIEHEDFPTLNRDGFPFDMASLCALGDQQIIFANHDVQAEVLPSGVQAKGITQDLFSLFNRSYKDTNYMSLFASSTSSYEKAIYVSKEAREPLNLVTKTSISGSCSKSFYIELAEGADFEITSLSFLESNSLSLENIVIKLQKNSSLHLNLLHSCQGARLFSKINIICEEKSKLFVHGLDTGATKQKQELHVQIDGRGVEAYLNGAYCLNQNDHVENFIRVQHNVEDSFSAQNYKSILDDKSKAVFDGSVFVAQGADLTRAEQLNKNLVLSSKAEIDTKPQLEIFADDVKCSHGATISRFLKDEIFYFQARGIKEEVAIDLLAKGFLNDCLVSIRRKVVKDLFLSYLQSKIKTMRESLHA